MGYLTSYGMIGLSLLMALPSQAGTVLTYKGQSRGLQFTTTITIEGANARIDSHDSEDDVVVILNGDQRKIYLLDPKREAYTEMDESEVARLKQRAQEFHQQLAEENRPLSGEQQREVRELMEETGQTVVGPPSSQKDTESTFEATGGRQKHGSYSCLPYRQRVKGIPEEEGCFIPWAEAGIAPGDLEALDRLETLFSGLAETDPQQEGIKRLSKYPGLPAHLVTLDPDGTRASEETLTSVSHQRVPLHYFQVPGSFKKNRMKEVD